MVATHRSVPGKIHTSVLKLISLHNHKVVIRIIFSYWFSGP